MHGLFVGNLLANENRVVNAHNLVAGNHSGTLCGPVAHHVLHTYGVLAYGKLDAHSRERALQVVVHYLHVFGTDVYGVRVELGQNLRHGALHELVDVDGVHILVVDNVQQVVQLVAA